MRKFIEWLLDWDGEQNDQQKNPHRKLGDMTDADIASKRSVSKDGSVTIKAGRFVVSDPQHGGRFPVIAVHPGITLTLNGEPITEATPVSSVDVLEWSISPDEDQRFYRLTMDADLMVVSLELLQDPYWLPDDIELIGTTEITVAGVVRQRGRSRAGDPVQAIRSDLAELGVAYGLNEPLIAELVKKSAERWRGIETIARGQMGAPPVAAQWEWASSPLGLVEPGQTVGTCTTGSPNVPRIDVTGKETRVYADVEEQTVILGSGVRRLTTGQIVSTRKGRLVTTSDSDSTTVEVKSVRVINDPLTPGTLLDVDEDVVFTCNQSGVTIKSSGAAIFAGDLKESEVDAHTIEVHGVAEASRLRTIHIGHPAPFMGMLRVLYRQLNDVGTIPEDYAKTFRRIQTTVMKTTAFIKSLGIMDGELTDVLGDYFKTVMSGPEQVTSVRFHEMARDLATRIGLWEEEGKTLGSICVRGNCVRSALWSGRDVLLNGHQVYDTQVFAGREMKAATETNIQNSDLLCARHADLAGPVGAPNRPSTIRVTGKAVLGEVTSGVTVEIGFQTYKFQSKMYRVTASLSNRYELQIKPES